MVINGSVQQFEWLYKISDALHRQGGEIRGILQTALSLCGQALSVERGCILTFGAEETIEDAFLLGQGADSALEPQLWNRLINQGVIGFVQYGQRTVVIRNIKTDPRWPRLPQTGLLLANGSVVGVPLMIDGRVGGVMMFIHPEIDFFNEQAVNFLETAASTIAAALETAQQNARTTKDERYYRAIHEFNPQPTIITNARGEIIGANRSAYTLLAFDSNQLVGMSISTVQRLNTDKLNAESIYVADHDAQIEFQTTARTARGDSLTVTSRAKRIKTAHDDFIIWTLYDQTAQVQAEQLKRDLIAMTYHDLRGPLHNINGSLGRVGKLIKGDQSPALYELLELAGRSTRQLASMVKSLLDIERIEEGKVILDRKPTMIPNLLADATELVAAMAEDSDQRLVLDIEEQLPLLTMDQDMILRVITNLIENAMKYTPSGGRIVVGARAMQGGICISVSDNGPGVPRHVQEHIFDKYVRLKNKNAPNGVGLGLAFCRMAVEAHGGRIWVSSEPGAGSVFSFILPGAIQITPEVVT